MGNNSKQLINQEMSSVNKPSFKQRGNKKRNNKYKRTAYIHLTPSQRKISSIRKEIAIMVNEQGIGIEYARKLMNDKYGKGWRERGLSSNPDNQWSEEDLYPFL